MTPAETLRRARALIERPEAWTTGELARDASRNRCEVDDPCATCWCAEGALLAAGGSAAFEAAFAFLRAQVPKQLHRFNDERTHADVLAAFDRAISAAEAEEGK